VTRAPGLYPLIFEPRFKERVWGGRRLASLYGKQLPHDVLVGESWEISDRPDDESMVVNGPLAGRTLRSIMQEQADNVLGEAAATDDGRFPLLCKILDAREALSLQVHPPARAKHLGDPKTEMWYIADADRGAELFVGLKPGATRHTFESALADGRVAECLHRVAVRPGDAMFLPSGRVHAIGAGVVLFEIQQNSDTTFRVYDWDRLGLDGKPRTVHVRESMASIDFDDVEPALVATRPRAADNFTIRPLVRDPLFNIDVVEANATATSRRQSARPRVLACVRGHVTAHGGSLSQELSAGQFCLLPARVQDASITAEAGAAFLVAEPGPSN
jgi:mannose-6-phosphate isomerase